ncbi:hypothetical protein B0H14DRAFT_2608691 [Mycena olivaceomarginata]|nr:hypothetical protein B0H14DRAFT_2608691 [Mycena olivaceomarginata]
MSLTWSVCRSFLPTNLISKIDGYLDNARMPTMANTECGASSAHRDDCFAEFCLSWTVDRKVDPPKPTQKAAVPAMAGQSPQAVSLDPDPVSGGANFVDVTLKVKSRDVSGNSYCFSSPRICMAQPAFVGAHTRAATICFASRIKQPLKKHSRVFWWSRRQGQGEGGAGEGVYQNSII